jgi:hypothetical protein
MAGLAMLDEHGPYPLLEELGLRRRVAARGRQSYPEDDAQEAEAAIGHGDVAREVYVRRCDAEKQF